MIFVSRNSDLRIIEKEFENLEKFSVIGSSKRASSPMVDWPIPRAQIVPWRGSYGPEEAIPLVASSRRSAKYDQFNKF